MGKTYHLEDIIKSRTFRFERLVLEDIDNSPVFRFHSPEISDQETCLFHRDISHGDSYFEILHNFIEKGLKDRRTAPIVRFADGEYAFYENDLSCNGLYKQAESVEAIQKATPLHIEALKVLAESGKITPLIYPGNTQHEKKGFFSFLRKPKGDNSASKFVDFLFNNNIELNRDSYLPFYVVYAYLTSKSFASLVDGRKICIVNSECNMDSCIKWFERLFSHPDITFAEIPDSYVATRWETMKEDILNRIPPDTELCLVGAGIGALLVCVDVAHKFSIPALDAGHVLNMMNDYEDKSNGPRLYTTWKL